MKSRCVGGCGDQVPEKGWNTATTSCGELGNNRFWRIQEKTDMMKTKDNVK